LGKIWIDRGDWAACLPSPLAAEAKEDLAAATELVLKDRLEDSLRGLPEDTIRDIVAVG